MFFGEKCVKLYVEISVMLIIHTQTDLIGGKGIKMRKLKKIISAALLSAMLLTTGILPSYGAELVDLRSISVNDGKYDSGVYITCKTDRDMILYTQGETVTFTLALWDKSGKKIAVPGFSYTILGDAGEAYTKRGYELADENGDVTITATTMNKAGYVRLEADVCDSSGNSNPEYRFTKSKPLFQGGVLVDAQDITTSAPIPDDFAKVWQDQLALLDEVSPDIVRIEKVTSFVASGGAVKTQADYPELDIYAIYIDCLGNPEDIKRPAGNTEKGPEDGATHASAYMSVPRNKAPGSLGIKFGFVGYGIQTVSPATWDKNNICFNMLAHSLLLLPEEDPSNFKTHYSGWVKGGSNYGFDADDNSNIETCYMRNMLLRNAQTLRFALKAFGAEGGALSRSFESETMTEADVNACLEAWRGLYKEGNEISVSGGSQGGFQAIGMAALCPEVTSCSASSSWMCDTHGNLDTSKIQSTLRPAAGDGIIYCDTANLATLITCKTTLSAGIGDTTCPPPGNMALYNNLVNGKDAPEGHFSITWTQGKSHDGGTDIKDNSTYKKENYSTTFKLPLKTVISDWNVTDGVLTVKGSGVLAFTDDEAPWLSKKKEIKSIILDGDFVSIGAYALDMSGTSGVKVQIPKSVKNISESAFNTATENLKFAVEPASYAAEYAVKMNIAFEVLRAEEPSETSDAASSGTSAPDESTPAEETDPAAGKDDTQNAGEEKNSSSALPIVIGAAAAVAVAAAAVIIAVRALKKKKNK